MKPAVKIGLAVLVMGILMNLLMGGGADKEADIPAMVKNGALIVDTRTAGEFAAGHIDGAINIPYDQIAGEIYKHTTGQSDAMIVYCRSGRRSGIAKRTLIESGYTNTVNGGGLHHMQKLMETDLHQ